MRVLERVPYAGLRMPGSFLAFLDGDPAVAGLLPERARDTDSLLRQAEDRMTWSGSETRRQAIARALATYAAELDAPPAVREAARLLSRAGTYAVVTAQAPSVIGGPLYLWHKVATALRLTRELRALPDAPELVTIFWNDSEDPRSGEDEPGYVLNPSLELERIGATPATPLSSALAEAGDLIPGGEHREPEFASLAPATPDEAASRNLSRQLFRHFGGEGLLILDSSTLPGELRAPLLAFFELSVGLREDLKRAATDLVDHGFDVTVDLESAFLFERGETARRRPLADGLTPSRGARPSPALFFRHLWQDLSLPVLAYIAGPGEISCLALMGGMYDRLDIPRPPILPRASLTHCDPRLETLMDRFELGLLDFDLGPDRVEARICAMSGVRPTSELCESRLSGLAEEFTERLEGLEADVRAVDPKLILALARLAAKTRKELDKLALKLANQRRNRNGSLRQHALRLCHELLPQGRLQERVLPALPFLVRQGLGFSRGLLTVADPFASSHVVVGHRDPS